MQFYIQYHKILFFQHYYQLYCDYLSRMGRMGEKQAVIEQWTRGDFKKWSFTALKTFNNSTIKWMTIVRNKCIMSVVFLSLLLIYRVNSTAALVNFVLFWKIFKILKITFWTFWRKNCVSLAMWALFFLKTVYRLLKPYNSTLQTKF